MLTRTSAALTALATLLVLAGLATLLLRPTTRSSTPQTYYVAPTGLDSRSCDQARSPATPRATINGGIGCLAGGDTLLIAAGTYSEWLITSLDGSLTVSERYTAVQPGTRVIPSGRSADAPTRLLGATAGTTVLSPTTKNPETGTILGAIGAHARFLVVENLHFVKAGGRDERSQGQGIYLADSQDVTLRGGSVYRGGVKSSAGSQRLTITAVDVGFSGEGCDFSKGDPTTNFEPCPHGMYLCGQGHAITGNYVHDSSHTGIQVSCETTNSSATIHGNRVVHQPGPGIGLKGSGSITSNVLEGNGTGLRPNGEITVANNTIIGYYQHAAWVPDPWGILYEGSVTVVNNLLYAQKSAFNLIAERTFKPVDPSRVHHQMCDLSGNAGCTSVHPASAVFTQGEEGDYTLTAGSPARGAGVTQAAVTTDLRGTPYPTPPDLGAYSSATPTPEPPQPPPGAVALRCAGRVEGSAFVLVCSKP